MQHFAVALTTILLICSCKLHEPEANLSVSDVRYYYIINSTYLLDNSSMKDLTDLTTFYFPTDYYIKDNNTYEAGIYRDPTTAINYPCVKVNGTMYDWKELPTSNGPSFIEDGEELYVLLTQRFATGEKDHNGNPFYGRNYYISQIGETPYQIGTQKDTETGNRMAAIKRLRKYGDKFYAVGTRDRGGAYFSETNNLESPLILSLDVSEAYDFCMPNDSTFLVCGHINNQACIWVINGANSETTFLPTNGAATSGTYAMEKVGDDIYIGGNIGDKPAIWKNGEILGVYNDFPPHNLPYYLNSFPDIIFRYHSGFVRTFKVVGDKVYSIVIANNEPNHWNYTDNKPMAVEWDFSTNPVTCSWNYDLVEMMIYRDIVFPDSFYHDPSTMGTMPIINIGATYWDQINYSTPRIALMYNNK